MNTKRTTLIFVVIILLIGTLSIHSNATAAQGDTTRVSVASDGTEGDYFSFSPAISGNGRYIAFRSDASNLVADDTNDAGDVFVHDLQTGDTTRVSVASDGSEGSDFSSSASISWDGRYVAFSSHANNLVEEDSNGEGDIFVHDRETAETILVSTAWDGSEADDYSSDPSISADGRYVAFVSNASNLVSDDTNGFLDVFVHDRESGDTTRVSVTSDGLEANLVSVEPAISGDGRYVAFTSYADNLVEEDNNGGGDVFVHDRQTGETTIISKSFDGGPLLGEAGDPSISADGRYIAFESGAENLVPGDANSKPDIFLHDRQTGTTTIVSVASDGTQGNDNSDNSSISADGRFVAFQSFSTNLVADDNNGHTDIFLHDRQTGDTTLVSVASDGTQGDNISYRAAISSMGKFVAFESSASNLVADDTNGTSDIFVHETSVVVHEYHLPIIIVSD